ncbi:MAG TPA: hypothetical protein DCE71_04755, partial [Parachlamydiales bacterium]|nr:hypothetical protein [Parachlamydiales bacterium]
LKRAQDMLEQLEAKTPKTISSKKEPEQLSLFGLSAPESPALIALKSLDVNQLTPLAALQKLAELKDLAEG